MKRAGVRKTVALTHGHEVWWAKVFPFNLALRKIGTSVDSLTYLGEFTKQAISQSLSKASAKKMVKIAPGIDVEHFSPQDSSHCLCWAPCSSKRTGSFDPIHARNS
jgi:phosphatidylinositol alpha-1,6-mannosyltransferase